MTIFEHAVHDIKIAELRSSHVLVTDVETGKDLLGTIYYAGYDRAIVHQSQLVPEFFDLSNKMAGHILQKFSNYRVRLAIVGDFTAYSRKSIQDFIYESNKGKQVNFLGSVQDALDALTR